MIDRTLIDTAWVCVTTAALLLACVVGLVVFFPVNREGL